MGFADQVVESFRSRLQKQILSLDSFSISVTSYAQSADLTWPLVTIPDFAVRGWTTRQEMNAETLGFLPIVTESNRDAWEGYAIENQDWVTDAKAWENSRGEIKTSASRSLSLRGADRPQNVIAEKQGRLLELIQDRYMNSNHLNRQLFEEADFSKGVSSQIYTVTPKGLPVVDEGTGPFTPIWMTSPAPRTLTTLNFNLLSHQLFWKAIESLIDSHQAVLTKVLNLEAAHEPISGTARPDLQNDAISAFYYPVFDDFTLNRTLVGILASEFSWNHFFDGVLPSSAQGIVCVVENACNQIFTYRIDGSHATFLGEGDLHDPTFDHMVDSTHMAYLIDVPGDFAGSHLDFEHCPFTLHIYPSDSFFQGYHSGGPAIVASTLVALFVVSIAIFLGYDRMNARRRERDSKSVVVLERMFPQSEVKPSLRKRVLSRLRWAKKNPKYKPGAEPPHFKATIRALPGINGSEKMKDDPFSNATVMFVDVDGLESRTKNKEPEVKNSLLDTIHRSLNVIAKRHGIFQVEMAGDCFVAVTGMQNSEDDHAAIMAHFACDCRKRMVEVFKSIPAKGLSLRFGIHSGHVQAGLYGNESSRFQLFGDTVDTTYQMLTNGKPNKIHISVETAELLNLAGKSHWISPRKDVVLVRGKGEMSTFWIKPKACLPNEKSAELFDKTGSSVCSESTADESDILFETVNISTDEGIHFESVVDRAVSMLLHYLKKIHARRIILGNSTHRPRKPRDEEAEIGMGDPIIEESREVVQMPFFDPRIKPGTINLDRVELPEEVESQLRLFVSSIASTYRDNRFHNIEHAVYTTTIMDRVINKITTSDEPETYVDFGGQPRAADAATADLDFRTFGIASDPLTQFGMMFSALVHDVDHVGVSNYQLIQEKSPIAGLYNNKSVAEQNSVDITWWLLMTPNFSDLRQAIYADETEMRRLRQLLVNSVMATDILDRDLTVHRDRSWNKCFRKATGNATTDELRDLKATVAIEHIAQAADVAHTLQSFRTYLNWSEKLFHEMFQAYHAGRAEKDPSDTWYVGELAFFDKFVIPLATRLRDSGVLGSSGSEYLKNAKENRRLWAETGETIMREMLEGFSRKVIASQEDTIMFT